MRQRTCHCPATTSWYRCPAACKWKSSPNASPGTKLSVDVEVDTVTCLDVIAQTVIKAQEELGEQQPSNACQGAQQTSIASPSAVLL